MIIITVNPTLANIYVCAGTGEAKQYPNWYKEKGNVLFMSSPRNLCDLTCNIFGDDLRYSNFTGIDLIVSTEIVKADLASKTLVSDDGKIYKYQTLLIATGSTVSKILMISSFLSLFVLCSQFIVAHLEKL